MGKVHGHLAGQQRAAARRNTAVNGVARALQCRLQGIANEAGGAGEKDVHGVAPEICVALDDRRICNCVPGNAPLAPRARPAMPMQGADA
jgi:hypothetical protein